MFDWNRTPAVKVFEKPKTMWWGHNYPTEGHGIHRVRTWVGRKVRKKGQIEMDSGEGP